jgi:phenylacetate-CoA ligase
MLSSNLWRLYFTVKRLKPYWKAIDRCRQASPSVAREQIAGALLAQIRYFGKRADALPEWRDAFSITDPSEIWKVWSSLPIITREDLRTRFPPARMGEECGVLGQRSSTGGSTGEPTPYLHDAKMLVATTATRTYARLAMGWKPGMPTVCVWGSERDVGKSRTRRNVISGWLRNDILIDGYRLGDHTVEQTFNAIRRFKCTAVFGFTSMLEFVARRAIERGIAPRAGAVVTAWNGGEMLFAHQSELFRKAFGVPILNLYGGRELSVIAQQRTEGEPLEVVRPLIFVEIVNKHGKPVGPNEPGRILCTSTVCRGTPFLRYEIGDTGTYAASDEDESGIRSIRELHGRTAGVIELPNGRLLNCLFWNHLFKDYSEVHQFQVVLRGAEGITLRLKGRAFETPRKAELLRTLANTLGDVPVSMEWLLELPRTSQGKLVQVISEAQA